MRTRRLLLVVLAAAVVVFTAGGVTRLVRFAPRPPALGGLQASPAPVRFSVKVGETVRFTVAAAGARDYTWSVWGRPVSLGPSWSYVPGPEDAGLQLVKVTVTGPRGERLRRIWDVEVISPAPPELVNVAPPPGTVQLRAGAHVRFRCGARLETAQPSTRVRFDWTVDDRPVLQDVRPPGTGISELLLGRVEPGIHRVVARVSEVERVASLAQWTVVVTPAEPGVRLVRAAGPRQIEPELGEKVPLTVRVEPEQGGVAYDWIVDGKPLQRSPTGRLDYEAATPGRHRIGVTASVDGRRIGSETWVVAVRGPTAPPAPSAPAEATPPAEPAPTAVAAVRSAPEAPAASELAEAEVRGWLEEYARAWSRKDVAALRGMGQVTNAAQAERLERYFASIGELRVDVRVLALRVDGARAAVELERTDTLTDPAGHRKQLRLPPLRKEIERGPNGLRFTSPG